MSTEQAEEVQVIVAEGVAREGLQEMVLPAEEAVAKGLRTSSATRRSTGSSPTRRTPAFAAGRARRADRAADGPGYRAGAGRGKWSDHLGHAKGDPAGNGSVFPVIGSYGKTLTTTSGSVRIIVPRDRKSVFEPQIVVKGQRRVGQVDEMILSLYAAG